MCAHPGCRPSAGTFKLKGPAGRPPDSGWALKELPIDNNAVRSAWLDMPREAGGPVDALWRAESFLAANGITGTRAVLESYAVDQWCRPDPRRCNGYDPDAPIPTLGPFLPWATAMWEQSNHMLNDTVTDDEAGATLYAIVQNLTTAIEGPEGCGKCAGHWTEYRQANPPVVSTLADARLWLWAAHNHTRYGKEPVPFEEIANKFSWN